MIADVPDLLRLVAIPAFGWAAWQDVKVRRVPNRLWYPLAALGLVLLAYETWTVGAFRGPTTIQERLFVIRVTLSLGMVVPLAYLFWRLGGFGGADAKAFMIIAVLVPTVPWYEIPIGGGLALPANPSALGVFSLTVLTNTVLLAAAYPAFLTVRNLLAGERAWVLCFGKHVPVESIVHRHGSLMETPDGYVRRGLDLDALRMYLRWRGVSLADLRQAPDRYRDPASLPDEPNDPTDGAINTDGSLATDGGEQVTADETAMDDPWGAEAFLDDVGSAWGTTPEGLRAGLEVLTTNDRVWYSPGMPFVVPMFLGLVVGFVYGDLLFAAMGVVGLA